MPESQVKPESEVDTKSWPYRDIGSDEFGSLLESVDKALTISDTQNSNAKEGIMDFLHVLDTRERQIIEKRFALFSNSEPQSYSDIGKAFNVSDERIRQLVKLSLSKLGHALTSDKELVDLDSFDGLPKRLQEQNIEEPEDNERIRWGVREVSTESVNRVLGKYGLKLAE